MIAITSCFAQYYLIQEIQPARFWRAIFYLLRCSNLNAWLCPACDCLEQGAQLCQMEYLAIECQFPVWADRQAPELCLFPDSCRSLNFALWGSTPYCRDRADQNCLFTKVSSDKAYVIRYDFCLQGKCRGLVSHNKNKAHSLAQMWEGGFCCQAPGQSGQEYIAV